MTIKVTIRNDEQPVNENGIKRYADLTVTVIEAVIVNGKSEERRDNVNISAGMSQIFHVYSARSLLLSATNKP